jgi:moderate conductance mechanosensitive channel
MRTLQSITVVACAATLVTIGLASTAVAQASHAFGSGDALGAFLSQLSDRLDHTIQDTPNLGRYLLDLPQQFDLATTLLLLGIVVAGVAAEFLARRVLRRVRHRNFVRYSTQSPIRAFLRGALLDAIALLALAAAARFVVGLVGDPDTVQGKVAHQILNALVYWRGFNFVFRAWLHPATPEGRIAPVDNATAGRLLVGLNVVILLPALGRHIAQFLAVTSAGSNVIMATIVLYVPVIGAALIYAVWYWRHDMATWLVAMVNEKDLFRAMKLAMARQWWIAGIAFYVVSALAAIYAAITGHEAAVHGLAVVQSMLILLLLLETLIHRRVRRRQTEMPTFSQVIADCLRLVVRLLVIIVGVQGILVDAFGVMTPNEWEPHRQAIKLAAITTFVAYALWRFLSFRMDRYIAGNPLPTAGFGGGSAGDEDGAPTASRLRTIMPVLKVAVSITILILGSLLVLSELGFNITPLIACASVLGLAVSFGSQSLVRDIVSGIFFLVEDSFRVGEYIDVSKVKGTVEGFSIRSIRLRHQNGQLHIVPFGQLPHVTNFSRDWTTVKFSLAFALETDAELLRKTVKKIGLDMMNEPQFQKELLQPLKMQGIVDIKDASLIVRFKFTATPNNPSIIQRTAIRRIFEALPKLGIQFAKPPYAPVSLGAPDPAVRAAAQ